MPDIILAEIESDIDQLTVGAGIPPRPPIDLLHATIAAARAAGISALWCIDHFTSFVPQAIWDTDFTPFAVPGTSPDEIFEFQTMLGYTAAVTGDLRLGVGVTEAIRRHPLLVAQAFLTLSHLTTGKVMIGIGAGERENTEPYGYPFERPVSRLEEALRLLRLCFETRGPFDFHGEFFHLDKAILDLKAGGAGRPEIWVAAHGPRTLRLAGTYGDGWYPTHPMNAADYAAKLGVVRTAAAAADRDPAAVTPGLQIFVALAPTRQEARSLLDSKPARLMALIQPAALWAEHGARHPLGPEFAGIVDFIPQHHDRETIEAALSSIPEPVLERSVEWGTPDDLIGRIQSLEQAGLRHVVLNVVPGLAHPAPDADHSVFTVARRLLRHA